MRIGGFLGGAPTTRNMSQTLVLSGNSLTGWYLWVLLLSRSLWMSVSIFLTKSFPWCRTKVAYFTEADDELDEAGADMEGPDPQALPEADDEKDIVVVVGEKGPGSAVGVDTVGLMGTGRDLGLPDISVYPLCLLSLLIFFVFFPFSFFYLFSYVLFLFFSLFSFLVLLLFLLF